MPDIVVNGRFLTQFTTGVQRYAIEMSRRLKSLHPSAVIVSPHNILHRELAEELGARVVGTRGGYYWEQVELPAYLKKNHPGAMLINLANMAPVRYRNKIVTIHDVAPLRYPECYSRRFAYTYKLMLPLIARTSRCIISDSIFSKRELGDLLSVPEDRVKVVPAAVSPPFDDSETDRNEIPEKPYILAVSSLDPRKNFARLVSAFSRLDINGVKLLIVGSKGRIFPSREIKNLAESTPDVVLTGSVDDSRLRDLYANADLFVYPSLYEGFGLPPLEAMVCGCPCIVSNVASLPEICGDAAVYCDPYDVDDIASKISQVLRDSELRSTLIEKGRRRAREFCWDKSARALLEIISESVAV